MKKGFISMTVIYSFLLIFIFTLLALLLLYTQKSRLVDSIIYEAKEKIYLNGATPIEITYTNENCFTVNGSIINGYTCTDTDILIPPSINGINITEIADGAFYNKSLSRVILPSNLKIIGEAAFEQNNLTSIIIPQSVDRIWGDAFSSNSLVSVTIKGKLSSSDFATYGDGYPIWGWASSVTCTKNNTSNVTNGCITWEGN